MDDKNFMVESDTQPIDKPVIITAIEKEDVQTFLYNYFFVNDIPEGISMAVPMKNGGMKISKVIFYVILSGITTGIGAFFGAIIGSISQVVISICLSFAAGAMLYIVSRRTYTRI